MRYVADTLMLATNDSAPAPDSNIEMSKQPRLKVWFGMSARSGGNTGSPSSSGRAFLSHDPGWMNPFSRLPATPHSRSATFEDVALDASDTPGNSEPMVQHPDYHVDSAAAQNASQKRSASDRLRDALHLAKAGPAERYWFHHLRTITPEARLPTVATALVQADHSPCGSQPNCRGYREAMADSLACPCTRGGWQYSRWSVASYLSSASCS